MRRIGIALALLGLLALLAPPAIAKKQHRHKKPAGVEGVVRDGTCPGPCIDPAPPEPVYTGAVTIEVRRAFDWATVASQAASNGQFRFRLKPGTYDVTSVPPVPTPPPPCEPSTEIVCPAQSKEVILPCLSGETQRVDVRRRHFTHVELHVRNSCIV